MNPSRPLTRRAILRQALLFSAALAVPRFLHGQLPVVTSPDTLHLFALGDWGTGGNPAQKSVAIAMQDYARRERLTPEALLFLGDNFYGPLPGVDSPRWKREFEDMYPAGAFPGPCYAVLGNHDYDDQPDGEKIQMAYAQKPGTRWKMPARWYRLDLPAKNPVVTLLCLDTHYQKLSAADIAEQQRWLEAQLDAPRTTPWLFVCGHHPVLSCGPHHGDSKHLTAWQEYLPGKKVHAYLAGHEHDLQHLRGKDGFTDWLVSGGGGRDLHPVKADATTQFARESLGFLHLAITPGRMIANFVGIEGRPVYTHERTAA